MIEVPRLTIRARTGVYAPGQERVVQILETALDILIEEGYRAVTMREIARRCGVRVGAISHYYKSRSDLLQDLLNGILNSYEVIFDEIRRSNQYSSEEKLSLFISAILDDILTEKTTNLFPELWAMANHDPMVAKIVDIIYIKSRAVINEFVLDMNPKLDAEERETVALFISASLEGMTVFAGWEKPWAGQMPMLKTIACRSLIDTVKTMTSQDLKAARTASGRAKGTWTPPTLLNPKDYAALTADGVSPAIGSTESASAGTIPSRSGPSPDGGRKRSAGRASKTSA